MNATIDVGSNLTALLERLAAQVGTTADKIFPWYVQQQVIEGWVAAGISTIVAVAAVLLLRHFKTADFERGNHSAVYAVIGCVLAGTLTLVTLVTAPHTISKILNPEFHAMRDLSHDVGRLVGK